MAAGSMAFRTEHPIPQLQMGADGREIKPSVVVCHRSARTSRYADRPLRVRCPLGGGLRPSAPQCLESFIGEEIFGKGFHAASCVSCSTSAFRAARSAVPIRRPRSVSNQRCVPGEIFPNQAMSPQQPQTPRHRRRLCRYLGRRPARIERRPQVAVAESLDL